MNSVIDSNCQKNYIEKKNKRKLKKIWIVKHY